MNMLTKGGKLDGNVVVDAGYKGLRTMHFSGEHAKTDRHGKRYEEPMITAQMACLDWYFWPSRVLLSCDAEH